MRWGNKNEHRNYKNLTFVGKLQYAFARSFFNVFIHITCPELLLSCEINFITAEPSGTYTICH